jgi:hypothetical protein
MYLFCGSSSIRQFHDDKPGTYSFTAFSGATIKGLMNRRSTTGHGAVIHHLAAAPMRKTVVIMLGNVDLDFSYFRGLLLDPAFDPDAFLRERVVLYGRFLQGLLDDPAVRANLRRLCVLAPQPSPLRGEGFFRATAGHARLEEARLRVAADQHDLSHAACLKRTLRFNDMLQMGLPQDELLRFHRIDRHMVDGRGGLLPRFYPARARDHHAVPEETLPLWQRRLHADVEAFAGAAPKVRPPGSAPAQADEG